MTLAKKQTFKSPSWTIHAHCHYCVQSRLDSDVEDCTGYIVFATGKPCSFYKYRMGNKRVSVKVLRQFCIDCVGGSKEAVKQCSTIDCLNHRYRFGKNPALARKGKSFEEMALIRALRRASVKENPVYFKRSTNKQ